MEQLLLFVLLGLGPGALIAGIALGLVLTYRGSGVINVSAGATAMFGAYFYYGLREGHLLLPLLYPSIGGPLPLPVAFVVAVAVTGALGLLIDVVVFRPLRRQSPLAKLVAGVGVLMTIQAIIVLRFGGQGQSATDVLDTTTLHVLGGTVPVNRLELVGIVLLGALLLSAVYRYSRFGLATRAAQENEAEALLSGLSPQRLSMANSFLAATVCGALGILVAPMTQLDPNTLTIAVVPALGAALIARFTSFPVAALAGIAMGALRAVTTYGQTQSWFPTADGSAIVGVTDVVYFLVIVAALIWRGKSLPVRGAYVEPRLPPAPAPKRVARPTVVLALLCTLALLTLPYDMRQALTNTMIGAIACLSLVVLTGFVGQMSLAQYAFAGVAGLTVSKLALNAGIGFPVGPILGVLAATVLGVLIGIPALRVRGVQLAVLTMAAAVAVQAFGFNNPSWGAGGNGSPVAAPTLFGVNLGPTGSFPVNDADQPSPLFGFVCLGLLLGVVALVVGVRRSSLGKRMLAVRSNERAAAAVGISTRAIKLSAFALSAFIVGIAGVLYAYNFGSVDPSRFDIVNTFALIAFAYIGGITTIKGALIAGFMVTEGVASHVLDRYVGLPTNYQLLIAGVLLVVTLIMNGSGIALQPPPKFTLVRRLLRRPRADALETATTSPASARSMAKLGGQ
ncbi:ABC transporter permease [Streptomyces sp. NPDC048179]|uniref:ABC transporter permease n=1 Tax=Streptomyces sp. NPDC048179 TaxID=3365506 RepID=UPI00371BEC51